MSPQYMLGLLIHLNCLNMFLVEKSLCDSSSVLVTNTKVDPRLCTHESGSKAVKQITAKVTATAFCLYKSPAALWGNLQLQNTRQ